MSGDCRVVSTDGLVLGMRMDMLDACAMAKDVAWRRKLACVVVRDDGTVLKLSTPETLDDNALWLRICRAQPRTPADPQRAVEDHAKKGGRSKCEHDWQQANGSDWRCPKCDAWGWQRSRLRYSMRLRERAYPVIARICRSKGCKEAATWQEPDGVGRLHYWCDLHAPAMKDAAE